MSFDNQTSYRFSLELGLAAEFLSYRCYGLLAANSILVSTLLLLNFKET